jgi:ribosomal protein S18 acetylase RimI-like enzyme
MPEIKIRPFHPDHQAAVKNLVLDGLVEHWGFLDETKNPDLEDIAAAYAGGTFLVAWVNGEIAGTGATLPRSETVVEVVRMSVSQKFRRQGIGVQILQELCKHAAKNGYKKVVLETTKTWQGVIAFYQQYGFQFTHYDGDDAYFELDLLTN